MQAFGLASFEPSSAPPWIRTLTVDGIGFTVTASATELRNFSPTHFEPSVARGLTVLLYEGKQAVGVL